MKKIVLWIVLVSLSFSASEFKSCEESKKKALSALAENISTTVESAFSSKTTVEKGFFDFSFKQSKHTMQSKSRLSLSQVKYSKEGNKICALVSKKNLILTAKGKVKEIRHFTLKNLPKDEIKVIYYLNDRIDEIKQAKVISSLFPDSFDDKTIALLEKKYKLFFQERSRHHAQKIDFIIKPENAILFIDGKQQLGHNNIYLKPQKHTYSITVEKHAPYKGSFEIKAKENRLITLDLADHRYPQITILMHKKAELKIDDKAEKINQAITLMPGEHHYYLSSKLFCPMTGSFTLKLGETKSIEIDSDASGFAQLTVNSNKEAAKLTVNGKAFKLGQTQTFKGCKTKEVSFSVRFEDQVQTQTLTLTPGYMKTISVNFLSNEDKKLLNKVASVYRNKNRLVARIGFDNYENETLQTYGGSYIWHKDWLRHGFGFDWGDNDTISAYHLHYSLAIQLTSFGSDQLPFHIGNFSLIPYIGTQVGFTHKDFGLDKNGQFAKLDTGVDLAINSSMSLQLFFQKNFYLDEETRIGIALSLTSPF